MTKLSCLGLGLQVRNLCYMISRREKLKLSYNKLQEQIFGLQVKLANEDIAAGKPYKVCINCFT